MDRRQISVSKRPAAKRPPKSTPEIYWLGLAGFILLCLVAGAIGGSFAAPGLRQWYGSLSKPTWAPPNAIFGPVWMTLYVLMAVAAWRVWVARQAKARRPALILFMVQLGLNVAWPLVFFTLRMPGAAAIELGVLWVSILATTVVFFGASRIAALLMTPYLLWVTFAGFLNIAIWRLNG